jgi:hypothetical protein
MRHKIGASARSGTVSAKREMLVRSAISLTSEPARRPFGVSLRTFDQSRRNPKQPPGLAHVCLVIFFFAADSL